MDLSGCADNECDIEIGAMHPNVGNTLPNSDNVELIQSFIDIAKKTGQSSKVIYFELNYYYYCIYVCLKILFVNLISIDTLWSQFSKPNSYEPQEFYQNEITFCNYNKYIFCRIGFKQLNCY